MTVDVLANDLVNDQPQIISVTQPEVGSVVIRNNQLDVSLPSSFAGDFSFDYTVVDSAGAESTATVTIFSANVLIPVSRALTEDGGGGVDSVEQLVGDAVALFLGLVQIRLSPFELGALGFAPLLLGAFAWFSRRERLISITSTARSRTVSTTRGLPFEIRHDALLWTKGKTRSAGQEGTQIKIELPTGDSVWIDQALVVDTGF